MDFKAKIRFWLKGVGIEGAHADLVTSSRLVTAAVETRDVGEVWEALKNRVQKLPKKVTGEALSRLSDAGELQLFKRFITRGKKPELSSRVVPVSEPKSPVGEQIYFTRHDGGLTLIRNGKQTVIDSQHPNFSDILVALEAKKFDEVNELANLTEMINARGKSKKFKNSKVFARGGKIYSAVNGKETVLHDSLSSRILDSLNKPGGEKFADALLMLEENIQQNQLKDIREELYEFLLSGKAPITYDGCFLAYKRVRRDFRDQFTGLMDNSPGKIVRMDPDLVDRNRHNECSKGLHFATRGYLHAYMDYGNSRTVIVKVNPKNVYAIPTDYQFQKGRASEYFVVGEFRENADHTEAFIGSFIDEDTKLAVAPNVEFIKTGLRPSLEMLAKSYDLIDESGRVNVVRSAAGGYDVVKLFVQDGQWYNVRGQLTSGNVESLSFKTKSVREAVKYAVNKLEKKLVKKFN